VADEALQMNLPSEDQVADMLSDPNVAQSMNEALNNPNVVDFMIQQNPMLRNMPNAREFIQSPYFRNLMTNPDSLRMASRMRGMMGGGGGGGGGGGASAFPAPGATDTTPEGAPASAGTAGGAATARDPNPFGIPPELLGALRRNTEAGGAGAEANPFLALLNNLAPAGGSAPAAGATANAGIAGTAGQRDTPAPPGAGVQGQAGTNAPAANPFANLFGAPGGGGGMQITPEMMQHAMEALAMGGGGGIGGGAGGGYSAPPPDNRPPEERYADQLRQLNDMGFYDFDQNIAALRRSGGSVQGAIQHLLGD